VTASSARTADSGNRAVACAIAVIGSILLGPFGLPNPASPADVARFSIAIRARSVDAPYRTIRATQGMTIELAFTTDETVELHLHGYDYYLTVNSGKETVMQLDARLAGRFAIEAHGFGRAGGGSPSRSHVVLLYVEIHPR
jgi:hypothetical protein